jgi:uridine kinase
MTNLQQPVRLIGITGGSCTGKTTLEYGLSERFGDKIAIFPFDDMFVGRSALGDKVITNWEDPELYRWDDFISHVRDLKMGRATTIIAKSRESKAAGIDQRHIESRPVVLVVGFLALHNPGINDLYDTKLYLELSEDEIVRRRKERANSESPWDTDEYINGMLIPGHRRVVVPQRDLADHIVDASLPPEKVVDEVAKIIELATKESSVYRYSAPHSSNCLPSIRSAP